MIALERALVMALKFLGNHLKFMLKIPETPLCGMHMRIWERVLFPAGSELTQ